MNEEGNAGETLLTVKDAAAHIGVSESAIRNATLDGRLPSLYMYGRKLIKPVDLEEYRARSQPDGQKVTGRPKRATS